MKKKKKERKKERKEKQVYPAIYEARFREVVFAKGLGIHPYVGFLFSSAQN
jgi:hypothetical protein